MSHQIIKQPNDKFALWSTIVEDFLLTDCDPDDIIEYEIDCAKEEIKEENMRIINGLKSGKQGHYSWEYCTERINSKTETE